jgi:hypothetical protein
MLDYESAVDRLPKYRLILTTQGSQNLKSVRHERRLCQFCMEFLVYSYGLFVIASSDQAYLWNKQCKCVLEVRLHRISKLGLCVSACLTA